MAAHNETQHSPYTPQQLFDMVADIERYPEFIPWCRAARILERDGNILLAELVISFNHLSESYTSRVTLSKPEAIEVVMVKGPFEHLTNSWRFTPAPQGGTNLSFALDFKFRSTLLEMMMGGMFTRAVAKMTDAFRQRADALYGK